MFSGLKSSWPKDLKIWIVLDVGLDASQSNWSVVGRIPYVLRPTATGRCEAWEGLEQQGFLVEDRGMFWETFPPTIHLARWIHASMTRCATP